MAQLLWHLLAGTRGGVTRLRIIDELLLQPANAQQLADRLGVDYRTVGHHLDILLQNGLVTKPGGAAYGALLYPSRLLQANLKAVEDIRSHMRRAAERPAKKPRPQPGLTGGD